MITFTMRDMFFDRAVVKRALDDASRAALSKQGATIRTIARRSMRYVSVRARQYTPSKPGEPPKAIQPHPFLRKFLYSGYDTSTKSVVIGPEGFHGSLTPSILEYGGTVRRKRNTRRTQRVLNGVGEIAIGRGGKPVRDWRGRRVMVRYARLHTSAQVDRANRLNAELYGPGVITANIKPRPYMAPALLQSKPETPKFWKDSIRRKG